MMHCLHIFQESQCPATVHVCQLRDGYPDDIFPLLFLEVASRGAGQVMRTPVENSVKICNRAANRQEQKLSHCHNDFSQGGLAVFRLEYDRTVVSCLDTNPTSFQKSAILVCVKARLSIVQLAGEFLSKGLAQVTTCMISPSNVKFAAAGLHMRASGETELAGAFRIA